MSWELFGLTVISKVNHEPSRSIILYFDGRMVVQKFPAGFQYFFTFKKKKKTKSVFWIALKSLKALMMNELYIVAGVRVPRFPSASHDDTSVIAVWDRSSDTDSWSIFYGGHVVYQVPAVCGYLVNMLVLCVLMQRTNTWFMLV